MNAYIQRFVPLVDFLADVMGPHVEIVLHDFSNVENSVIAIRNGHISGRQVGAPATDLALKIIRNPQRSDKPYLCNYQGVSEAGHALQSSSFILRDSDSIVGMLCINVDLAVRPDDHIVAIASAASTEPVVLPYERMDRSFGDLVDISVAQSLSRFALPPERLSPEERAGIIRELEDNGVFLLKGSIGKVAARLKLSEPTVYRYLHMVRKEED